MFGARLSIDIWSKSCQGNRRMPPFAEHDQQLESNDSFMTITKANSICYVQVQVGFCSLCFTAVASLFIHILRI